MLRNYLRAFYSTSEGLTDKSNSLQNASDGMDATFADGEYLYIGQQMPFNNFFAWMDVPNEEEDIEVTVEYWSNKEWVEAVDVIDGTKGFTQSGQIQFVPDKDKMWQCVYDTSDEKDSFELEDLTIYNLYWIRIKCSAELSETVFKRIAYAFCLSDDLKSIDPTINNYLTPWGGESKTDWIEQIIEASEQVVIDLKQNGLIVHPGQLLLMDDVALATKMKTLQLIYPELGEAFADKLDRAAATYSKALNIKRFTIDTNKSAMIEESEFASTVGELER